MRHLGFRDGVGLALGLLFGLAPLAAWGAQRRDGVAIEPRPSWVDALATDGIKVPEPAGGVAVEAIDQQFRAVGKDSWSFVRSLLKVTTELGARTLGEQKIPFMPPYQRLLLHTVEVRRAGQSYPRLDLKNVRVLEREEKLDQNMYNGAKTAVVIIPDVRVGDEVLIEQSIVGANPVLAGHFGGQLQLGYPFGVGRLHQRVVVDRSVDFRPFGKVNEPEVETHDGITSFRWWVDDTPAAPMETDLPREHDTVPWVQVTDLRSWGEAVAWGHRLFALPKTTAPAVAALAEEIRKTDATRDNLVLGALRLVQDRVRYLALAFGTSSHRPAAPDVVLARGYGDCKDKSLLLLALLRELGLQADVALVNLHDGGRLQNLAPTMLAFDHAVVTLELDGIRYWLDPARLYQRGRLRDVSVRGLRHALRLAEGVTELTRVEEPIDDRPDIRAHQRYSVTRFGGGVALSLTTVLTGPRAEEMRAIIASGSTKSVSDTIAQVVRKIYPKATTVGEPVVEDTAWKNELVVSQELSLENDWSSREGAPALTVFPIWLVGQLPTPAPDRKGPLGLFPLRHIVHSIELVTSAVGAVLPSSRAARHRSFVLQVDSSSAPGRLTYHYDFRTVSPRVEPADLVDYRASMAQAMQLLDVAVVAPKVIPPASRTPLFSLVAVWTALCVGGVLVVHRRQPYVPRPRVPYDRRLRGIGGALALLAFGVTVSPIAVITRLIQAAAAYSAESWTAFTAHGARLYHPAWETLLTVELLGTVMVLVGSLHATYLFWSRRRSFPLVFGLTLIASMSVGIFSLGVHLGFDLPGGETLKATAALRLVPIFISAAWVAYLFESRRVRATFLPAPAGVEHVHAGEEDEGEDG